MESDLAKPTSLRARSPLRAAMGYVLMVTAAVGGFLLIRRQGETLLAPVARSAEPSLVTAPTPDVFLHVLVALTAIIITGQVLARLFARLGQPAVIGEVVAGILLGPSLLGPQLSALILPPSVGPYLGLIAQLGVVLYMFLVGLELNPARLKERTHATIATSHASILVPFMLGSLLALLLYPQLSDRSVPFTSFALFLGVAMSITAFPVLARILTDYRLTRTHLGVIALSCAAVDDVTAWCLLAFVVGVAKAQVGQGLFVVIGALVFIALILLVARPALRWVALRWETQKPSVGLMTVVFVALLLSALTAEAIGIHAIFGAFLLGVMVPHDSALARAFTQQLQHVVSILLLPAFFAFTGMRTRIDLLSAPALWLLCGLIILTAIAGKFGGTFAAARLTGLRWREAALLGALMNTRGLMELIVLNVGLELGVISATLFAMMVLMALVTTMLTSPLLRFFKLQTAAEE